MNKNAISRKNISRVEFIDVTCFDLRSLSVNPFCHVSVMMINSVVSIILPPMPPLPEGKPISDGLDDNTDDKYDNDSSLADRILYIFFNEYNFSHKLQGYDGKPEIDIQESKDIPHKESKHEDHGSVSEGVIKMN